MAFSYIHWLMKSKLATCCQAFIADLHRGHKGLTIICSRRGKQPLIAFHFIMSGKQTTVERMIDDAVGMRDGALHLKLGFVMMRLKCRLDLFIHAFINISQMSGESEWTQFDAGSSVQPYLYSDVTHLHEKRRRRIVWKNYRFICPVFVALKVLGTCSVHTTVWWSGPNTTMK